MDQFSKRGADTGLLEPVIDLENALLCAQLRRKAIGLEWNLRATSQEPLHLCEAYQPTVKDCGL